MLQNPQVRYFPYETLLDVVRNLKRFRGEGFESVSRRGTFLGSVEFFIFLSTFELIWKLFDIYQTFLVGSGKIFFFLERDFRPIVYIVRK